MSKLVRVLAVVFLAAFAAGSAAHAAAATDMSLKMSMATMDDGGMTDCQDCPGDDAQASSCDQFCMTTLAAATLRGFALASDVAPFVVINAQDARTAWTFSLMPALAHIWPGASGVSGKVSDQTVEKFCNDVASEFLLPPDELALMNVGLQTTQESAARSISDFARQRHLSSMMVAYNLARAGLITNEMYLALAGWFRSLWRRNRDLQKEKQKDNDGPNYYVVRRHRLGRALLDVVARSLSEGTLSPTKAGQILGVKPRNVAPLLNDVRSFGGRAA